MNDKQPAILALAVALAAADLFASGQGQAILDVIMNGSERHNALDLQRFVLEILLIAALVFVAGLSDDAGNVVLLFVVALWAVFLFKHHGRVFSNGRNV